MKRKILVAVDDSMHTRTCLSYLKLVSDHIPNLSMTLFHVQPTVSDYLREEAQKSLKGRQALETLIKRNRKASVTVLEGCREKLHRLGMPREQVEIQTAQKVAGLAKDIIDKGLAGQYDAIVAGRRGHTGLQKWMMGSVSSKLVEHSPLPVWIVAGNFFNARILVAVDGSAASLKAVDHVLFMAGENPLIQITLFHVRPTKNAASGPDGAANKATTHMIEKGHRRCLDDFYEQVRRMLEAQGMDEKRIAFTVVDRKRSVAQTILKTSETLNFGTVVLGKRGGGRAFYMGSVSNALVRNSADRVIWIVP
jgi:nucleotide-binding universal stress UspA family protein